MFDVTISCELTKGIDPVSTTGTESGRGRGEEAWICWIQWGPGCPGRWITRLLGGDRGGWGLRWCWCISPCRVWWNSGWLGSPVLWWLAETGRREGKRSDTWCIHRDMYRHLQYIHAHTIAYMYEYKHMYAHKDDIIKEMFTGILDYPKRAIPLKQRDRNPPHNIQNTPLIIPKKIPNRRLILFITSLNIIHTSLITNCHTLVFNSAHTPCSHTTDEGSSQLPKRLV